MMLVKNPYVIPGVILPATAARFAQQICTLMEVSWEEVRGKSRKTEVVKCREIIIHIVSKRFPFMSRQEQGNIIGGRDHATVLYYIRKVDGYLKVDKMFREMYLEIEKNI